MESFPVNYPALSTPAELLALEEALLEHSESTEHPGFLSFWEASAYFVVLGYSKSPEEEVFETECRALDIPILRRCSGGGTVLQGPGCLNYTLVLPIDHASELETITGANRLIMEKTRTAIAQLTTGAVCVQGHTDLTLNGLKFSGNAQRRKRRSLLFHGSFLLHFDLQLISKILRLPRQQPEYRQNRSHNAFLTNAQLDATSVQSALSTAWEIKKNTDAETLAKIMATAKNLATSKYSQEEWIRRS
jgi:lipoate-protein ligase A